MMASTSRISLPWARPFWVIVHRWAGLTLALFLTIAGLTGAIIAFEEPLSYAIRPDLSGAVPPYSGVRPLDAVTIAERVERQTGGTISYLPLEVPRDHVLRLFVEAAPGKPPLGYDALWVDPYSARIRLAYTWGGVHGGPEQIISFLYQLHYGYVAGAWGMWAFGMAALVWTLNCVVGFGLTLPAFRRTKKAGRRSTSSWWRRWKPAWMIRRTGSYKSTFDIHRATGLWIWPMLLVFAWSGVALALPSVERPVMRLFGASMTFAPLPRALPLQTPPINRRRAMVVGMRQLHCEASRRGFLVQRPAMLAYDSISGTYALYARTNLDAVDEGGRTVVWLDAVNGGALHFDDPIGAKPADRLMTWLTMLHMAEVFGMPYRIFVSLLGLAVTALSVTGILIWMRKRTARLSSRAGRMRHARGCRN
jgi:uncharacterized iron-regulated membrane protein